MSTLQLAQFERSYRWVALNRLPARQPSYESSSSLPSWGGLQAQTAAISGVLTEPGGRPVSGVVVIAVRQAPSDSNPKVTSNAGGRFSFAAIPAGDYRICVQAAEGVYLDPCWWKDPFATLPLKAEAGKAISGVRIEVEPATILQVRVNDPTGALTDPRRGVAAGVITTGGMFRQAVVRTKQVGLQVLEVPIPANVPVRLSINASGVALSDSQGRRIASTGDSATVTRSPGNTAPVVYTVSEVLP
ncbi:MAG: carboxypeptidase-like regulatory domain-containing protein [Bryobacteraceae bacterium]